MVNAVIVGHGGFAQALIDAAERIVGKQEGITALSNQGLSCATMCGAIETALGSAGDDPIIFVDLPGGSCAISCLTLMKERKGVTVITGVNLPMLIEFLLLRERYNREDLVAMILKKGKENIMQLGDSGDRH